MTRWANIRLSCGNRPWEDYAPVPDRFALSWPMKVMDSDGDAHYVVSDALVEYGMWEPAETNAMLLAFERCPKAGFIDFGANVGYYSVMAGLCGLPVLAIEGDPDIASVLADNARVARRINPKCRWIDGTPLRSFDRPDFRYVVKVDLEGADHLALRSIDHLADQVDIVLIELSPTFGTGWDEAVTRLYNWGLIGALVPDKARPPVKFDQLKDLAYRRQDGSLKLEVAAHTQRNALFVRPEVLK